MRWLEVHRHWLTKIGGGSAGPVTGGEAEGARGELVLFHQGGGVRLQELRIRGPMKSGAGGGQDHTTGRTPLAGVLLTSPPSRP